MSTFALLLLCAQACFIQSVFGSCWRGGLPMDRYAPGYGALDRYAAGYGALDRYAAGYGALDRFAPGYGALDRYAPGYAAGLSYVDEVPYAAGAYGGEGVGDVAVIGELPVSGVTALKGQVPILGAVQFAGEVPAAGEVTIVGQCGYRPAYLANRAYY